MAAKRSLTSEKVLEEYDIISSHETLERSPTEHKELFQGTSHPESEETAMSCKIGTEIVDQDEIIDAISVYKKYKENSREELGSMKGYSKVLKPPSVNCPEKIVICLDISAEMESTLFSSRAGNKFTSLELAKRSIKMFVMHKSQMNPDHEFALIGCHSGAVLLQKMTKRVKNLFNSLEDCEMSSQSTEPLSMTEVFETINENVALPEPVDDVQAFPPPFIVRLLLVYGRSHSVPEALHSQAQKDLESSPYFFTDVLYIHEAPSEDNCCEEVFKALCELDHREMAYIFNVTRYTPILNCAAKLLAHPLQRPRQNDASYKI